MTSTRPTGTAPAPAVAIATRDRPAALARCLESLGDGTLVPAEVVVADQSRGDAARRVVEEALEAGLPVRYLRARAGGLGAAQNDAVGATRTAVVAVLDDDCVADQRWLLGVARAFEADAGLALLGGRVLPLGGVAPGRVAVSSRTSTTPRTFAGLASPWDVGSGNNFAVRREWFDRVGGCDERLGPGAPLRGGLDMDLFHRVLRAGGRARYDPTVVVYHERTTREGRLARRSAYGFGMAAAIVLWLRQGDPSAYRVLARWLRLRSSLLLRAAGRGRWHAAWEELLVLRGTAAGLLGGLRCRAGGRRL